MSGDSARRRRRQVILRSSNISLRRINRELLVLMMPLVPKLLRELNKEGCHSMMLSVMTLSLLREL